MVPMVPKDKLSGHKPLGDRSRIGGYHPQVGILGFPTRLCLEGSEGASLYFDQKKSTTTTAEYTNPQWGGVSI